MGIRNARKRAKMTQIELAEKLNVTQPTIAHWERGITKPDITKLLEIARLFGCTVDELVRLDREWVNDKS